jgi:alkaline phosphatase D
MSRIGRDSSDGGSFDGVTMRIPALLLALLLPLSAADEPLRVLVWNTERGSNPYGPDGKERVLRVVRDSRADVVLWQESYPLEGTEQTLGAWVAERLGWQCWQHESPHLAVASRFERIDGDFHHPWHGLGARLKDGRGREFLAWSVWLDHRSPPQWATLAEPPPDDAEVLAGEATRFEQAQALLDTLDARGQLAADLPLLVGGDWNTSSHLDWTAATAAVFPQRRALPLPVSRLMQGAGFADTFRAVHPDPVVVPGNTWTPLWTTDPESGRADPPERIDRLYVRNPLGRAGLHPLRATVLPENPADARLPRESSPFPSDHAATLIEFEWRETTSASPGAFLPEPAAASPGLDHRPPQAEEPGFTLERLAFGSCYRETQPCPGLDRLVVEKPQLYLALGDNIYGDTADAGLLRRKYRRLSRQPAWQALARGTRVLATWDDHDYGADDSGRDFPALDASKEIFLDFFDEPAGSPRRSRAGIHSSTLLGPPERRVQILMLDLRSFRSPLRKAAARAYRELGGYQPLGAGDEQVMLGEDQWKWLEEELKKPARLRFVGLSTQLGSAFNGYEAWANLPRERERFFELLKRTRAEGVILLSGDTHWAELSLEERPGLYPIFDLTSSGLNQGWPQLGANPNRIGNGYKQANAGLIDIDWSPPDPRVRLRVLDVTGRAVIDFPLALSELGFATAEKPADPLAALGEGSWRSAFGELVFQRGEGGAWTASYPEGSCELVERDGALDGVWKEGERGGACRFIPSRCGRFVRGAYGRGEGPALLAWPAWRGDSAGVTFGD